MGRRIEETWTGFLLRFSFNLRPLRNINFTGPFKHGAGFSALYICLRFGIATIRCPFTDWIQTSKQEVILTGYACAHWVWNDSYAGSSRPLDVEIREDGKSSVIQQLIFNKQTCVYSVIPLTTQTQYILIQSCLYWMTGHNLTTRYAILIDGCLINRQQYLSMEHIPRSWSCRMCHCAVW
jgi:hypothetical protein